MELVSCLIAGLALAAALLASLCIFPFESANLITRKHKLFHSLEGVGPLLFINFLGLDNCH